MANLVFLTYTSFLILDKKKNNDIDIKLGPVTKRDREI